MLYPKDLDLEYLRSFIQNNLPFYESHIDEYNHLVIDLRKFPKTKIYLISPEEVFEFCYKQLKSSGRELYHNYLGMKSEKKIFVISRDDVLLINPIIVDEDKEDIQEDNSIKQLLSEYVSAYRDGLLKEAFERFDKGENVCFLLKDAYAEVVDIDDFFKKEVKPLGQDVIDEWEFISHFETVIFVYMDTKKKVLKFDLISEDTEEELREYWGML